MSKAADLRKEYEEKRKELQKSCLHKELSDWTEEWWALGHSTGRAVKSCKECEKIVHWQTSCAGNVYQKCENIISDTEEFYEHDGRQNYVAGKYCLTCAEKLKNKTLKNTFMSQASLGV